MVFKPYNIEDLNERLLWLSHFWIFYISSLKAMSKENKGKYI